LPVAAAYAEIQQQHVLEFPICIMSPLAQLPNVGDGIPARMSIPVFVLWTKAALLAAKHVNERNCAVLGPGCEKLLSANVASSDGSSSGGRLEIRLKIYFVDLHGTSASNAPLATQICLATDAQVIVGSTTSEQSSLVAAFVSGLGIYRRTILF